MLLLCVFVWGIVIVSGIVSGIVVVMVYCGWFIVIDIGIVSVIGVVY